jgi:predicted transcriptional regulator
MKFLTTGEIAKRLNVDRDTVSYVLRKLEVMPKGKAGNVRVFSKDALKKVRDFLSSKIERKVRNGE